MENKKSKIIILLILSLITVYFYYTHPNKFSKTYTGVKYRINNDNYEEKVLVKFEGKYTRKPFSNNIFEGTLSINNSILNNIKLEFNNDGNASIRYKKDTNDNFEKHYGWITIDKSKNYLIILLPESKKDNKYNSNEWTYENGLIISAPANSKKDAIKIANKLLNVK